MPGNWATSVLKIYFPAEFSFNPKQTHMNKLIKVFSTTTIQVSLISWS